MPGDNRPNLLFLMADQHRHDWLGAAGASWVATPNLDRLATRAVRFAQATCNSPLCAPSRISLATGLQPHRLGALSNAAFLPTGAATYYQTLRDAGYRVGFVGKIDLHKPDPYNGRDGNLPITYSYGFTDPVECEGKAHAGAGWDWERNQPRPNGPYNQYLLARDKLHIFCENYRRRQHTPVWYAEDSVLSTEETEDSYIGRRACRFLEQVADDLPWHLFVSFVGPHDPWDPPSEFGEHFRNAPIPAPISDPLHDKPAWQRKKAQRQAGASPDQVTRVRRQYTAALELIDTQIGRIFETLERRGQTGRTYVVYSSDHGEMLGDHGFYQKSIAYEAALRVPLLVAGPNIGAGVSEGLVELSDVNPTLLELAGLVPCRRLDARSFVPLLHDSKAEYRVDALSALTNFRVLRTHRHKLIDNYNDIPELYDLQDDPQELHNLAGKRSDLVATMRRRLDHRML